MYEENQPIVIVIAPMKAKLLEHCRISEEHSPLVKLMKETMARGFGQRYVDVHTASALDTRFKKLPFLSGEERDATFQCLKSWPLASTEPLA